MTYKYKCVSENNWNCLGISLVLYQHNNEWYKQCDNIWFPINIYITRIIRDYCLEYGKFVYVYIEVNMCIIKALKSPENSTFRYVRRPMAGFLTIIELVTWVFLGLFFIAIKKSAEERVMVNWNQIKAMEVKSLTNIPSVITLPQFSLKDCHSISVFLYYYSLIHIFSINSIRFFH